jgi:hypothetical protein
MKFLQWEEDITALLEHELEVCRSDAQGILEAQQPLVTQAWKSGQTARQTAGQIIQHNAMEIHRHD